MSGSTFMLVASGGGKVLPFLMLGCVTRIQSLTQASPQKKFYRRHESEKKRMYVSGVLEVEQGSFTPLVFTASEGMADECKRYHSRLAELLSTKKREDYNTTMSWICPPKVCAAMLEKLTMYAKSSTEHYR